MPSRKTNSMIRIENFKGLVAGDCLKSKEWGLGPPDEHKNRFFGWPLLMTF
jgi:hypothetical protein